jgi:hypothetical protein
LCNILLPSFAKQAAPHAKAPPLDEGMVPWLLAKPISLLLNFAGEANTD